MKTNLVIYKPEGQSYLENDIKDQVEDFQRRMDDMGHLYQEAVVWAIKQPPPVTVKSEPPHPTTTVIRSAAGRCGQILVAAGTRLVSWSQITEQEEDDLRAQEGGFSPQDYIYSLPPIRFDE